MKFTENENHILKYLAVYKYISVFVGIFGIFMTFWNGYEAFFKPHTAQEVSLHNQLVGASMISACLGYMMFYLIGLVSKLKHMSEKKEIV